jgi:hypothetical protein
MPLSGHALPEFRTVRCLTAFRWASARAIEAQRETLTCGEVSGLCCASQRHDRTRRWGGEMQVEAYPETLKDPHWKKVEKKIGVSSTGVGEGLRNAEKAYKAFADKMAGSDANAAKAAQKVAVTGLRKPQATLKAMYDKMPQDSPKAKTRRTQIYSYMYYIECLTNDLESIKFDKLKDTVDRYNDRNKMWVKWWAGQWGKMK